MCAGYLDGGGRERREEEVGVCILLLPSSGTGECVPLRMDCVVWWINNTSDSSSSSSSSDCRLCWTSVS